MCWLTSARSVDGRRHLRLFCVEGFGESMNGKLRIQLAEKVRGQSGGMSIANAAEEGAFRAEVLILSTVCSGR